MGQQQLLLVVLSAIVVGIAIIVGLNLFASGAAQANLDAVTQDVMTIASRAQEWYRKPTELGGGGRTWSGFSLNVINFPDTTINGYYTPSIVGGDLQIIGNGVEDGDGDGQVLEVQTTVDADSSTLTTVINNR
ncbi:hypothetical protein GWN42_32960 [candidate division KSB1 bacterium]|nr:hypothetical protein [candidate division KSB1 bacterium]